MNCLTSRLPKAALGLALGMCIAAPPAMANLSITPTIVLISDHQRYADVYLVNPTEQLTNYEIGWRYFAQEEGTGNYKTIDKSTTTWDLGQHMVFTPRRVAIEPNVAQKIRLGMRLNGEPPAPGDYRAHLEFMKIPDPVPLVEPGPNDIVKPGEKAKTSMGISVNVGFSIPVIYRVGDSDATAKIGDVKTALNSGKIEMTIPITKTKSSYGMYGTLEVYYKDKVVGEIKNANIFPEITSRDFKVPLSVDKMAGGTATVIYKDFAKDKDIVFDQKSIPVGN